MISRIKRSLAERARFFAKRQQALQLRDQLEIPSFLMADLSTLEVLASLKAHLGKPIDLLVDVGAHKGGFSKPAYYALGVKEILAFEPNPELLDLLTSELKNLPAEIRKIALAEHTGASVLHVHDDRSMSSLLPSDQTALARDFATYDIHSPEKVRVAVSTLDIELKNHLQPNRSFFLKIDTQGNELSVLKGSIAALKQCSGILLEYMFTTPYIGQPKFIELLEFLDAIEFDCKAALDIKRKATHRVSGVDFLFLRRDS